MSLADARLEAPIVLPKRYQRTDRAVVAASCTGLVFASDTGGNPFSGFRPNVLSDTPPTTRTDVVPALNNVRAEVITPIAAADLYGDGHFQVLVASGSAVRYAQANVSNGAVYCWSDTGQLLWRYPQTGFLPGFGSGVSVGRVRRDNAQLCAVVADATGKVYALDRTDGHVVWSFQIEKYPGQTYPNDLSKHPYHRIVPTQPLIADVNNDGLQEVIVGNSDGQIYAIQQKPAPNTAQGQIISGFPLKTIEGPESTWFGTVETHGEEIYGLALVPLKGSDPSRAYLLATTKWPAIFANSIGGHAYLFDLGANSWNGNLADWPQSQQNAQKTGYYPGP